MNIFNLEKNSKNIIIVISIIINILLVIGLTYLIITKNSKINEVENDDIAIVNTQIEENINEFYVEIKGSVKKPGVYLVNDKNIINDVVKLAGGFKSNAYTKNINLSKKVVSEMVIYVFTNNEYKKSKTNIKIKKEIIYVPEPCECSNYIIDNCTDNKVSEIIPSDKDTIFKEETKDDKENVKEETANNSSNEVNLVNINTATMEELQSLSGIGASKAKEIINYRLKEKFNSIEDIKNVSGIGDALFAKIKDYITV